MSVRPRTLVVLSICAGAICAALVVRVSLVARGSSARGIDPETERLIREGQAVYHGIEHMVRIDDRQALAGALDLIDFPAATEQNAIPEAEELRAEVERFLYLRFGQPDPGPYIEWRRERGYIPTPWEQLRDWWDMEAVWPRLTGAELPGGASHEELFAEIFQPSLRARGGEAMPVRIAAEPEAVGIALHTMTRSEPWFGTIKTGMGEDLWEGRVSAAWCAWWKPPRTSDELLEEFGRVQSATVGAVMEMADGTRYPVMTYWVFDPVQKGWFLESMGTSNAPGWLQHGAFY